MTSGKDDFKAALEHKVPSVRVPRWELEFHLWEKCSSEPFIIGNAFKKLSSQQQKTALNRNAEIIASMAESMNFSAVTVPNSYWEIAPGEPAYYWLPGDARYEQTKILRKLIGDRIMLVVITGGVMGMPGAGEYVEFSYKLFDAPQEIDAIALKIYEEGITRAKQYADIGVEVMMSASDLADNNGAFYNNKQMERFILPYLKKWAQEVKKLGAYSILHTDGNINPIIKELADSGIDAIQAIDPVAKMDICKLKRDYGKQLCLCGNIDCGLLITGSPEEIYESTKKLILDCKAGGGFVLGACNAVQQEVPLENYMAMDKAWRDFGKY